MTQSIPFIRAAKQKTEADIVFCLDATASMGPCIDGVKRGLTYFVEGLQKTAAVDFRLRLIAYRDLHDPACTVLGEFTDFTNDIEQFSKWLTQIKAHCNQKERGAESALDALFLAIHSDWRFSSTQKTTVLITDDNTHPSLHKSTYSPPSARPNDNGILRVVQDLQELRHSMLYIVAPRYPHYVKLEQLTTEPEQQQQMNGAAQKVIADFVPLDEERYDKLIGKNWEQLMMRLGVKISATSIAASQAGEDDRIGWTIYPDQNYWNKLKDGQCLDDNRNGAT